MTAPDQTTDAGYWHWRISKKFVKGCLWSGLWVLPLGVLLFMILFPPLAYAYRAQVAEVSFHVHPAKVAIAGQLEANPQAKIDARLADLISGEQRPAVRISYKNVAPDGTIIVISHALGVILVFHPQLEDGKVQWSCQGNSIRGEKFIPSFCRNPLPDSDHSPK
ncbi:MAG: pilin [Zoogloeaceae bacterium]|jgi:hypothetical protein|nr:pilin [Zoogloeaceae bacterium]